MGSNHLWKKSLICLLITAVLMSVAGCGGKKAEVKEDDKQNTEETAPAAAEAGGIKIDYKTSELYTEEEMNAAVAEIMKEFDTWEGCEMHEISYTDDQTCKDNISYMGELDTDHKGYTDCIVFTSSFHSPKEGGGAWEADYEYEGWQWFLARVKEGSWELLTWGY